MDLINDLEDQLRLAMLQSDVKKLDQLIHDRLIFTLPNGEVITKDIDLEAHRTGRQVLSKLECLEIKAERYQNEASSTIVVATKMRLEGTYEGHSLDGDYAYSRVWLLEKEKWQVVGGHVTVLS